MSDFHVMSLAVSADDNASREHVIDVHSSDFIELLVSMATRGTDVQGCGDRPIVTAGDGDSNLYWEAIAAQLDARPLEFTIRGAEKKDDKTHTLTGAAFRAWAGKQTLHPCGMSLVAGFSRVTGIALLAALGLAEPYVVADEVQYANDAERVAANIRENTLRSVGVTALTDADRVRAVCRLRKAKGSKLAQRDPVDCGLAANLSDGQRYAEVAELLAVSEGLQTEVLRSLALPKEDGEAFRIGRLSYKLCRDTLADYGKALPAARPSILAAFLAACRKPRGPRGAGVDTAKVKATRADAQAPVILKATMASAMSDCRPEERAVVAQVRDNADLYDELFDCILRPDVAGGQDIILALRARKSERDATEAIKAAPEPEPEPEPAHAPKGKAKGK